MAEVELDAENGFDPDPEHLKDIIKRDSHLNDEFRDIIRVTERDIIIRRDLHETGKVTPNGDLCIFYRYFFSKYVSLRQKIDARSGRMNQHASIFPFQTNSELKPHRLAVVEFFKDEFLSEIRKFVAYHFGDACDFEHLKDLFLTNIDHFKKQHFQQSPSVRQLTRIIGLGSNGWRREAAPEYLSDYFDNCIRLNRNGTTWYKYFQTKFNDACDLYQKEGLKLPEKSEIYFEYLPEINCCELLLLLEVDFLRENGRKYAEIFRKYLFFFGHAVGSADPHPVSFIDETLFRCLLFKKKYETFRGNILELQWELWMMTLVNRRKHPLPDRKNRRFRYKPDEDNLREVIKYADQIPNIESAMLYYKETQHRRCKIFLVFDDVAFLMGYSRRSQENGLKLNYGQILKSALMEREIKTLMHYNAYLGLESRVDMPRNKTGICEFIRKLTEDHQPAPSYAERFLITNLEQYFKRLPERLPTAARL